MTTRSIIFFIACLLFAGLGISAALPADLPHPARAPRNLILIISDGTQLEHLIAASRYIYGSDRALSFQSFAYCTCCTTWDVTTYDRYALAAGKPGYGPDCDWSVGYDPAQGGALPYPDATGSEAYYLTKLPLSNAKPGSARQPSTDSASSATAIATGCKTDDGNLSWLPGDPDKGDLYTLFEQFRKERGGAIGVVSTVPFSHATPAAFVSHNKSRDNYYQIAHEITTRTRPEVVIGGGHPGWDVSFIGQSDLERLRRDPQYVLAERHAGANGGDALALAADRAVAEGKMLFGLFGGPGGTCEPPIPADAPCLPGFTINEENPQLCESAVAALRVLSRDPEGFALMIEQGDVDKANHMNDYAWMVGAVWDLDRAVRAVLDYIDQPGDSITTANTAVIVTADHATSYMRLAAPPALGDLPEQHRNPAVWNKSLRSATGRKRANLHYNSPYLYPHGEVTYGTNGHTNELVMLYAQGGGIGLLFQASEGLHYPGTRIVDDTDIYRCARAWLLE